MNAFQDWAKELGRLAESMRQATSEMFRLRRAMWDFPEARKERHKKRYIRMMQRGKHGKH